MHDIREVNLPVGERSTDSPTPSPIWSSVYQIRHDDWFVEKVSEPHLPRWGISLALTEFPSPCGRKAWSNLLDHFTVESWCWVEVLPGGRSLLSLWHYALVILIWLRIQGHVHSRADSVTVCCVVRLSGTHTISTRWIWYISNQSPPEPWKLPGGWTSSRAGLSRRRPVYLRMLLSVVAYGI